MRFIQRVVRNGNSAQVTLSRALLLATQLKPGDFIHIEDFPDGHIEIRPWINRENGERSSPGRIDPPMPQVPR